MLNLAVPAGAGDLLEVPRVGQRGALLLLLVLLLLLLVHSGSHRASQGAALQQAGMAATTRADGLPHLGRQLRDGGGEALHDARVTEHAGEDRLSQAALQMGAVVVAPQHELEEWVAWQGARRWREGGTRWAKNSTGCRFDRA